jgi:hypothetical protein
VALIVGFRPAADAAAWLLFCGLLVLLILATTWLAMFFGLLAKSVEGAGAFTYILMLLIFISPSFVPTDSMTPALRAFADNQPMTPIVQTMRSLLADGTPGPHIWGALAWAARTGRLSPQHPRPGRPVSPAGGPRRPRLHPPATRTRAQCSSRMPFITGHLPPPPCPTASRTPSIRTPLVAWRPDASPEGAPDPFLLEDVRVTDDPGELGPVDLAVGGTTVNEAAVSWSRSLGTRFGN